MVQPSGTYTVTAVAFETGALSQTRQRRSSAVVLAMKWQDEGHRIICITEPDGHTHTLAVFRQTRVPKFNS